MSKDKKSGTSGHGVGVRGGEMFKFDPYDYVIVGLDTNDGPEHALYDERIKLPVPETLIRNIAKYGVLAPVIFQRDGERVLVVNGRQRIRAARIVRDRQREAGEVEIQVRGIPLRGDDATLFGISRASNLHQADGPLTCARNAQRMISMGQSEDDVAVTFGVTAQTVRQWLKMLDLAAPVKQAIERGAISPTAAAALAKLNKADQTAKLADLTATGKKPTVADAANKVRAARGKAPVVTAAGKINLIQTALRRIAPPGEAFSDMVAASDSALIVDVLQRIGQVLR